MKKLMKAEKDAIKARVEELVKEGIDKTLQRSWPGQNLTAACTGRSSTTTADRRSATLRVPDFIEDALTSSIKNF